MNKKLPNIFVNKNTGIVKNNEEFYYGKDNINNETKIIDNNMKDILIRKKIDDIFNSSSFIYKARVIITTKDNDKEYTLIGRDKNKLLTIDNETILISDVLDIKKYNVFYFCSTKWYNVGTKVKGVIMKIKTKIILSITLILMFIIFTISILFRLNVFDKTKEGNESNIEIINKQVETKLKSGYKLLDINNEGILKSPYIKVENNKYNINLHDNKDNYINVFNEENITYYECKINEYCFNFDNGSYYFSNKTTTNIVDLNNPNFYVLSSFLRTNKDKIIDNTNIKVNYYVNLYHTKNGENIYKLIVIDENLDLYEFNYIRSLNFKRVNTCKISKVLYKKNNNKLSLLIIFEDTSSKEYNDYLKDGNI